MKPKDAFDQAGSPPSDFRSISFSLSSFLSPGPLENKKRSSKRNETNCSYRRPERVRVKCLALERALLARGVADGLEDPASADERLFFGIVFVSCCRGGGKRRRRERRRRASAPGKVRLGRAVPAGALQSAASVSRRVDARPRRGGAERGGAEGGAALVHRGAVAAPRWRNISRRRSQRARDKNRLALF